MSGVLSFESVDVQKILNRNITRSYWLMMGQGGYKKEVGETVENASFPFSYSEFREEAYLESSLIYCEAVESYNPEHKTDQGFASSFPAYDLRSRNG